MEFKSNEDFAEKYRIFLIDIADISAKRWNQSIRDVIKDIPSKNSIISDIVNYNTGYLRDEIVDIQQYCKKQYDNNDPKIIDIIRKCDDILDFLES